MTKLAVVGSRDWADQAFLVRALDQFHAKHPVSLVVSGGAKGADTHGAWWAIANGVPTLVHEAKWGEGPQVTNAKGHSYNPRAGHVRNAFIVRDADVVIAFVTDWATSRGTRNTVEVHAKAMGRPCFLYDAKTGAWSQNGAATAWLEGRDPAPAPVPDLGSVPCTRCGGTGRFITQVLNGQPVGPADSPCFRCGGKGHQTDADRRRNYGYDNFAPVRGE